MSVIITGMDMPNTCGVCEASGTGACHKWHFKESGRKRDDDCPLRSVEGLIEELEEYARRQGDGWDYGIVQSAIDIVKEYCGMEGQE